MIHPTGPRCCPVPLVYVGDAGCTGIAPKPRTQHGVDANELEKCRRDLSTRDNRGRAGNPTQRLPRTTFHWWLATAGHTFCPIISWGHAINFNSSPGGTVAPRTSTSTASKPYLPRFNRALFRPLFQSSFASVFATSAIDMC
jgi:hypothetical protein